jgi:hypothetical protein
VEPVEWHVSCAERDWPQLPEMEGVTNEELLEMIAEMDEGDLMEACDEVGVDWADFSSEDEMRVALRVHYGVGDEADEAAPAAADAGDEDEDDEELQEQRELIEMMDYEDAAEALAEEGVEVLEDTLEWMQSALLAHFTGRPIPGPGASLSGGGDVEDFDDTDRSQASTHVAEDAVYSGYLSKVAEGKIQSKRKPKRLYFELMSSSLVYYENPGGRRLREIDLSTAADIRPKVSALEKDRAKDASAMQLVTPLRTWELHADDPEKAAEWIRMLRKQMEVISGSLAEEAGLDLHDDDVIEHAFGTFEQYAVPGADGEEVLTKASLEDLLREEVGFAANQEYIDAVFDKFDKNNSRDIDVDEFLGIYKFMFLVQ